MRKRQPTTGWSGESGVDHAADAVGRDPGNNGIDCGMYDRTNFTYTNMLD